MGSSLVVKTGKRARVSRAYLLLVRRIPSAKVQSSASLRRGATR